MKMAGIQYKPVGVFWDIENCSIPKNKLPSDVIAHIRNFFVFNRMNHREYEFLISCDVTRLRKDMPDDINKAGGVTLAHVSGNSKNAADEKLRENMKKFVDTHASAVSPVIILISGDIDFVNDLRGYQTRLGCTIVLIHAPNCSMQLKVGWNEIYSFTDFCAAVRVNPALEAVLNAKNIAKRQTSLTEPKIPQNPGAQPKSRNKDKDPKAQRPQMAANMAERPQHSAQTHYIPKEKRGKPQIPQYNGVQQPGPTAQPQLPKEKKWKSQNSQNSQNNDVQQPVGPFPPSQQQRGRQPDQGRMHKLPNYGPNTSNVNQQQVQQQLQNLGHNNESVGQVTAGVNGMTIKDPPEKIILMVGGLPGKLDFKILKENLQIQANRVHGKVKYVKNGQAFITFNHKANADRAVELFNGKEVFGKKLNVCFTKSIPFEGANPKSKGEPEGFVMVKSADTAGAVEGFEKPKNKKGNSESANAIDSALAELGAVIGGMVAKHASGTKTVNKGQDTCPIQ